MYCFVILLLFNEMQMSVRRFSAIPHLRVRKLLKSRAVVLMTHHKFKTWKPTCLI